MRTSSREKWRLRMTSRISWGKGVPGNADSSSRLWKLPSLLATLMPLTLRMLCKGMMQNVCRPMSPHIRALASKALLSPLLLAAVMLLTLCMLCMEAECSIHVVLVVAPAARKVRNRGT